MRAIVLLLISAGLAAAQSKMEASVGWNFTHDDEGDGYTQLNGWYGSLSYNLTQHLGLTFEHESYWGAFKNISTNQHVWLGGVNWKLLSSEHKISPFVQPLTGDTRSSYAGTIQHAFTFQVAGGADIKLAGPVSLELVPAEYVFERQGGQSLNSYTATVGLQFSFGK